MELSKIRHAWPEKAGFAIHRPEGHPELTFLHFFESVEIEINGKKIVTKPHACILYEEGVPQRFYSPGPLLHDWMHLPPACKEEIKSFHVPFNRLVYPAGPGFITGALGALESEFFGGGPFSIQLIDAKLRAFLIEFSRACQNEAPERLSGDLETALQELRTFVFSRLQENWTVERMARQIDISPSRFHAVYKALFGTSPVNDLIHARITAAQNRLLGSRLSVGEVARELGYGSEFHFIRQFRKITGVSPGAYLKRKDPSVDSSGPGAYNKEKDA